jgi:hypothetical protein
MLSVNKIHEKSFGCKLMSAYQLRSQFGRAAAYMQPLDQTEYFNNRNFRKARQ